MKKLLIVIALLVAASSMVLAYQPQLAQGLSVAPETTAAYAVLVLRKAAVEADLAQLSELFTSEHPSVESKRFELHAIGVEMKTLLAVKQSSAAKLSSSVGGLILSKVALEVELNELSGSLTSQHPNVKRKRMELVTLEREIEKILR